MSLVSEKVLKTSVVKDAQVARYNLVFQQCSGRNINPISMIGDDDNRAL